MLVWYPCQSWVQWQLITKTRTCVTTSSYQAIVIGVPSTRFYPFRGLRQGDPLSSYYFLFSEVISRALVRVGSGKENSTVKLTWSSPDLSTSYIQMACSFFQNWASMKSIILRSFLIPTTILMVNK